MAGRKSTESTGSGVSRRDFLAGAGAGIALAATSSLMGCASAKSEEYEWDMETDFIQIGGGCGMVGGAYAVAQGDEVITLEKMNAIGGNTALSGGIMWLPMHGLNPEDTREKALKYLNLVRQDEPIEDAVLEAFVDVNAEMVKFVTDNTILEAKEFTWFSDYHPEWEGGIRSGRSIVFAPPGASDTDFSKNAATFLQTMAEKIGENGEVLVSTPATHLITRMGEDGVPEVLGVEAEAPEGTIKIKARKGVLLSAGGFGANDAWKNTFLRGKTRYNGGAQGQDGDGIKMAMEIGAELRMMHECWGHTCYKAMGEKAVAEGGAAPHEFDHHKAGAILVNRYGRRFCNEASDYDSQWRTNFTWENWGPNGYANIPSWMICDQAMVDNIGIDPTGRGGWDKGKVPDYFMQANTLEELAGKAGIDPAGLVAEVAKFNTFVDNEKDLDFHRGESFLDWKMFTLSAVEGPLATLGHIKTPPFYAVEVALIDIGTCGGPRINENAQVIHVNGKPIPRLYAAGNNAGLGGPGSSYGGAGGTCGPAASFAYIAAKHACALTPWE